MNYLDLFSGLGGFHEGLIQAGFRFDWTGHSEINKHAKSVYQKHFPQSEDLGDVTNINVSGLPKSKKWIVTGGWPCQDNSIAGKRSGQSGDTRSGLFSQIIRILRDLTEMGADVVFIGENVKGLYSVNESVDFLDTITRLTYLDKNSPQFTFESQLCNTLWFLPQNRERIYFVGFSGSRGSRQILPISPGDCGAGEAQGEAQGEGQRLRGDNPRYAGSLRVGGGDTKDLIRIIDKKGELKGNQDYAACLSGGGHSGGNPSDMDLLHIQQLYHITCGCGYTFKGKLSDKCPRCGEIASGYTNEIVSGTFRTHKDGQGVRDSSGDYIPTIPARGREDGSGQPCVQIIQRGRGFNKGGEKDVCPTISTSSFEHNNYVKFSPCIRSEHHNTADVHFIKIKTGIRRLTPTEGERLQGFEPGWTEFGKNGELISDSQRYKMIGNAVSVPVVKAIGLKLALAFTNKVV